MKRPIPAATSGSPALAATLPSHIATVGQGTRIASRDHDIRMERIIGSQGSAPIEFMIPSWTRPATFGKGHPASAAAKRVRFGVNSASRWASRPNSVAAGSSWRPVPWVNTGDDLEICEGRRHPRRLRPVQQDLDDARILFFPLHRQKSGPAVPRSVRSYPPGLQRDTRAE